MTDIAPGSIDFVPPAEVGEAELYHPKSWLTKYVFSQDAKVIAIQYSFTAHRHRAGSAGAVVGDAAAIGFPGTFSAHRSRRLLPVHHHARHDHGDLPSHRAVPRRLRQLPDPADGGRPRHGVPLCQHAELLALPAGRAGAGGELLRARRTHGRRLDALSAAGHSLRHPRATTGASFSCSSRWSYSSSASPWAA